MLNNEIYDRNMEVVRLTKNNNDNNDNNNDNKELEQENKIIINDLPFIEDFGRGLIRYNEGDVLLSWYRQTRKTKMERK